MKTIFKTIALVLLICSCSSDEGGSSCRFLLDIGVNETINLDLPQYSSLDFVSNSIFLPNIGGNAGIIVINTGSNYLAWDASDPTKPPSPCSRLNVSGFIAKSGCSDGNEFNLASGQPITEGLACGLKNYRVLVNGRNLIITN